MGCNNEIVVSDYPTQEVATNSCGYTRAHTHTQHIITDFG